MSSERECNIAGTSGSRVVKVLVRYADFFPTFSNVLVPLQDYGMSYGLILLFI